MQGWGARALARSQPGAGCALRGGEAGRGGRARWGERAAGDARPGPGGLHPPKLQTGAVSGRGGVGAAEAEPAECFPSG